ncbi:MAG: sulfatase-like hydrolase/transferase [Endomicrobium sp.]|nr:sulfatase-like hydrolase/transferase [Endomicrobium sp.]
MNKYNKNLFRLQLVSIYFFTLIAVFFVFRVALFCLNYEFFSQLSKTKVLYSFLHGLRFDVFVISVFCGIFLFLINVPIRSKIFLKMNCTFLNISILIVALLLTGDVINFKFFNKHLTTEVLLAKNHVSYFFSLAFKDYLFVTLTIILFFCFLFYFSFKYIDKNYHSFTKNIALEVFISFLIGFILIVFARGGFQDRILSIIDAYYQNKVSGELQLNGVFTSLKSISAQILPNDINISYQDALSVLRDNLLDKNEEIFVDKNKKYPLMRQRIKFNVNGQGYNLVIVLLESWQKDYIDSFAGTNYDVTPNFDKIAKESIIFDKFYANGQRSIMGLMSVFLSVPYVKGMVYFGDDLENCGQMRLPVMLAKNGYDNIFVQGDKRESDNAIAIANYLGFKESYGKQDIPLYHNYLKINKGYDIEGMDFFFKKIKKLKSPFLAFYFTTTTHIPYAKTILKSLEKYQQDGTEKTGYLNRLYYSDYALGEFFKKAKKEQWFDKTIFIMLSDHQAYGVGGLNGVFEKTKVDKTFKIPAIIYCPKLFKAQRNIELASQVDIVPTIIDILNIRTPYSSLGKSLFSKTKSRFIFLSYEGEQIYLINNNGVFSYDWKDYKNHSFKRDELTRDELLLFSIEKVIYSLMSEDRWYDSKILN